MIFEYTPMPGGADARPLLHVRLGGASLGFAGLVDTGSVNTIFDGWIADAVEIDLNGADRRLLSIGGRTYETAFVTTEMTAAGHTWEAEVGFASGWQLGWGHPWRPLHETPAEQGFRRVRA